MIAIILRVFAIFIAGLMLLGVNMFKTFNIEMEDWLCWTISILLFTLSFINHKKKAKKVKKVVKKQTQYLPFEKMYYNPYKKRVITDDIKKYMEGEILYLAGKKEQAKTIWENLLKKDSIDAMHGLMCYYIETGSPVEVVNFSKIEGHGYACFNRALVEYRGLFKDVEAQKMCFSFDMPKSNHSYSFRLSTCMKYFRFAALQDVAEAQYNLGYIYQHGINCIQSGLRYQSDIEQNYYYALYWYYRGAMRGHGGCISGLCEIYKILLPRCEENIKPYFVKAIAALEKWIENNADKICEKKLILKHFDVRYHEKHEKFDEIESIREFVRQAVGLMEKRKFVDTSNSITNVKNSCFEFNRYATNISFKECLVIPQISVSVIFKGSGDITYGTYITTTKDLALHSLKTDISAEFEKGVYAAIKNNPYCAYIFETKYQFKKESNWEKPAPITQFEFSNFTSFLFETSIDENGVSIQKYVYVPPKKVEVNVYTPAPYDPPAVVSGSFSFGDDSEGLYITTGSTNTPLYRDTANSNIYHDAAGNKYYSSDNGNSFTVW